ncbi:hypothetical protein ATK30_2941 [Amycolatopsis echigonensis]|uniref:Uncharacterized protein n=1 Tax=Amycolatopsis echigonensis TaxID=2576905 RepID=A0A2N3WE51_9PSEU|nr:hypothetical protein [Amycolatopsis niigatensis]PKV92150.1 hypothetical protein ATK30_2941 [Amycolatopsis niigatensis]
MAEQRDHGKPEETPSPGSGGSSAQPPAQPQPGGGEVAPRTPSQPTPQPAAPNLPQPNGTEPQLDPEQLRQFQEFQRFQEYLRFTRAQQGTEPAPHPDAGLVPAGNRQPLAGGQPPSPPNQPGALTEYEEPPRNRRPVPRWVKRLGGKILGWVIALVILGILVNWGYHQIFPSNEGKSSAQIAAEGGGTYHTNHIFSTNPNEAVRFVYHNIAQGRVDDACGRFREDIQDKFAKDTTGQPDCKVAVEKLHAQVKNMNDYAESLPSYVSGPTPPPVVTIDSCTFSVQGGPALGVFQVTKVDKGQWLITGHSPGPEKCPAPPTATSTPG